MSRCLLLLPLFLAPALHAQDKAPLKRAIYDVRHGSAKNLAEVLNKHFQADPFQAVPEMTSNTLLLSGPKEIVAEAREVLERLDRAPRQVALEVWIAEAAPPGKGVELSGKALEGPMEEVRAHLEKLHHQGHITTLRRFELKASENLLASVSKSEQKTFITGSTGGFGKAGGKTLALSSRSIGTKLAFTPRIPPEGGITLEMNLEDSRPFVAEDGAVVGTDELGSPIRVTELAMNTVEAKLTLRSGQAIPVQGVVTRSKHGTGQIIVVVGVRLLEEPRPK